MLSTTRGVSRAGLCVRAGAAALAVGLVGAGSAEAGMVGTVVLDTFDDPMFGALGQTRTLGTDVFANPNGSSVPVLAEVLTGPTVYSFQSGPEVQAEGTIQYMGFGEGLNAVALGVIGFELDVLFLDAPFEFDIELDTGMPSVGMAAGSFLVDSVGTVSFGLGELTTMGAFDPADIDRVILRFNTGDPRTTALDFTIGEFRAQIPTPGVLGVAGLGCLFAARRRRR